MARQKLLPFPEDDVPLDESGLSGGDARNVSGPEQVSQAVPASKSHTETTGSSLFDEVLRKDTLNRAWHQVRANKGAPGVDGVTVDDFPAWIREHKETVLAALRDGSYRPSLVRRVDIPKPGGGSRMLGVPTVLDRVIQQAIVIVLTPDPRSDVLTVQLRLSPEEECPRRGASGTRVRAGRSPLGRGP